MPLEVDTVLQQLEPHGGGWSLKYVSSVDSTNRYLRDHGGLNRVDRLAVVCDYQSDGRGRAGRRWSAPPGTSLLVSILVDWKIAVPETHGTMLAALSVLEALRSLGLPDMSLKWPNDVIASGRKLCGILTESLVPEKQLLIGCGVNVNFDVTGVSGIPATATSVQTELGHSVSREQLLVGYLVGIDNWMARLNSDPEVVFDEWRKNLVTIGRPVQVIEGNRAWEGQAIDAAWDGSLVVRTADGRRRHVYAGDVSIR